MSLSAPAAAGFVVFAALDFLDARLLDFTGDEAGAKRGTDFRSGVGVVMRGVRAARGSRVIRGVRSDRGELLRDGFGR